MLLFIVGLSSAAVPSLLPLSTEPVVGDQAARVVVTGVAAGTEAEGVGYGAQIEGAIAGRVAIAATIDGHADEVALGGAAKVQVTGTEQGVDAAVGGRYRRDGFQAGVNEVEVFVAGGADLGSWRVTGNLVGGTEIGRDEGDVELLWSSARALGEQFRVGVDAQGRYRLGGEEGEEEREGLEERKGDVVAGLFGGWSGARASTILLLGARAAFLREGESDVEPLAQIGIQVTF